MTSTHGRNRRLLRRPEGDAGMGLILVVGISAFVFVLAATAVAYATNGINQSRNRTGFEQALTVAESGVDRTLSDLQTTYSAYNRDFPVPGPISAAVPAPWCEGPVIAWPTAGDGVGGVFATEDSERAWARTTLEQLVATNPGCIQESAQGEYVVLKPGSTLLPKAGTIYGLSAVPSFADPEARTRLIKSEYIFMPYRPTHAVLAGGSLTISASTSVLAAYGVDPALASIHANATISGVGSPTVSGPVTSTLPSSFTSGGFPGGVVGVSPPQRLPKVSASAYYYQAPDSDPAAMATWYDLCPNGAVRPHGGDTGPCSAPTSIGTASGSLTVRGWNFDSGTRLWSATRDVISGTYYAHEADITSTTGTTRVDRLTLIASAQNATTCTTKRYGNIDWNRYDIDTPAFRNLWMYADTDIVTHSNFSAGRGITAPPVVSGMFVAGDQVSMQTSSSGAVGSVVVADQCPTPSPAGLVTTSEIKNPSIYFDPYSEAPFTSVITTSLWLDYSG